jgi:hypothetical protein
MFRGSMSITTKTHGRMKWSNTNILFGPKDHPTTELSNQNLPFVVMLRIGRHKVVKTLINNGASLNLIMRKTFIEMGLSLVDLTPVHDTFHTVIPAQSSTPIGHIDIEVSCVSRDNKHNEMLMFEVVSFNIRYNCILGRSFLLKFMVVIHTAYATMKMPGSKDVITIKADHGDALACESVSLSHDGRFGDKAAQKHAIKVAKTKGGSTPSKPSGSKPPIGNSSRIPPASKGINVASTSTPSPTKLLIPQCLLNYYHFWTLIRAIIRSASPLTMKKNSVHHSIWNLLLYKDGIRPQEWGSYVSEGHSDHLGNSNQKKC